MYIPPQKPIKASVFGEWTGLNINVQRERRSMEGFSAISSGDACVALRQGRLLLVVLRTGRRQYVNCVIHNGRSKTRRPAPVITATRLFRRFGYDACHIATRQERRSTSIVSAG